MAAAWLTALKIIPWADVIEAAPGLAKSAKGFFKRTQEGAPPAAEAAPMPPTGSSDGDSLAQALQRITAMESRLAQIAERQQAAAALIDSLASQNARLVEAVDALDKRCQGLKVALCIVAVAAVGALIWVAAAAR
ncbi:MAG: hypothetical protein WCJ87_01010 [Burkholderiales bacterium]